MHKMEVHCIVNYFISNKQTCLKLKTNTLYELKTTSFKNVSDIHVPLYIIIRFGAG